jgi:DedD protein
MADRNNELNDIILNGKKEKTRTNKKILLGIGGMTLILIIIVTIMGRIMHTEESQLPSVTSLETKKPEIPETTATVKEALEEINKNDTETTSIELDTITEQISNKLKEENLSDKSVSKAKETVPKAPIIEEVVIEEPAIAPKIEKKKPQAKKSVEATTVSAAKKTAVSTPAENSMPTAGNVYIQVGAFSKYKPDASFLQKITNAGYTYTFFRVVKNGTINNKVLVGPFSDNTDARKNLTKVRKAIEPGAFIYTIKQ